LRLEPQPTHLQQQQLPSLAAPKFL
jgi:hypothetical protein